MACKQGIRQDIEASKRYCEEQRRYDPFDELWKSLVHRVYKTDAGYAGLSAAERRYYSVGALDGAVLPRRHASVLLEHFRRHVLGCRGRPFGGEGTSSAETSHAR
jgi:hypothetical protein